MLRDRQRRASGSAAGLGLAKQRLQRDTGAAVSGQNVEIVRRLYEAMNARDADAVTELATRTWSGFPTAGSARDRSEVATT